eukprot:c5970_g1_i1.p1 GENE.c5970_g1_i1~~c5970_g1_i1.p1  ORF type:complete len:434 (-),score=63.99 c5970_g1_i1:48-1349(-)
MLPLTLLARQLQPVHCLGGMAIAWGGITVATGFVRNGTDFILARLALGIASSALFPVAVAYLALFFRPAEKGLRVAVFYASVAGASSFGGLLATGILKMRAGHLAAWRWLFVLEGIPSVLLGGLALLILPQSPRASRWLSPGLRALVDARTAQTEAEIAAAAAAASEAGSSGNVSCGEVLRAFATLRLWAVMTLSLCIYTPAYTLTYYLPAILDEHLSHLDSNLLSVPVYAVVCVAVIAVAVSSDGRRERPLHAAAAAGVAAIGFGVLTLATWRKAPIVAYSSTYLCATGAFSCVPLLVTWTTELLPTSTQKAAGSAAVIASGNIGGILGPQLYGLLFIPDVDEPVAETGASLRKRGSFVYGHLAMTGMSLIAVALALWLRRHLRKQARSKGSVARSMQTAPSMQVVPQDDVSDADSLLGPGQRNLRGRYGGA